MAAGQTVTIEVVPTGAPLALVVLRPDGLHVWRWETTPRYVDGTASFVVSATQAGPHAIVLQAFDSRAVPYSLTVR